ncbi:MAG TPA: ABC transporter substrate-binding protein [Chloroflexota bacterium]|nr:ABC transporter substrate-binding protein [Chloroflexota bacterium]
MARSGLAVVTLLGSLMLACTSLGTPGTRPEGATASTPIAASPVPAAGMATQAPTRLVLGHIPATHSAGIYIAYERGYLAEQGIEAEVVPFPALTDALVQLNTGQLDAYAGGTGANLYNAVLRGIGVRAVADKAHSEPGVKYKGFVARRDLWDSGELRTIAALRGRPVASLPSGGGVEYQMEKVLQTADMTVQDIQYRGMPIPDQLAALANKAVDAAWLFQPALCTAERRNLGVVIPPLLDDVAPGLPGGVLTYSERLIREKPQAARGLMVAYLRAVRDYMNALVYHVDRAPVVEIMQKYVNLPDLSYYDECDWGRINPNGYIDRQWIEDEVRWSVRVGLLERPITVDQLIDDSFVDYALQVLGPYQPPR